MASGTQAGQFVEDWPEKLHADLQSFLDYWRSKRGTDGRPLRRAQIDPREIVDLLPGIAILERADEEQRVRFRYRLVGTGHYEVSNFSDLTGRYVDEIYDPETASRVADVYQGILESGEPHYWRGPLYFTDKFRWFERIIAPLTDNADNITMLIGMWVWHAGAA